MSASEAVFDNFAGCVPTETVAEAGAGTLVANLPKDLCCKKATQQYGDPGKATKNI